MSALPIILLGLGGGALLLAGRSSAKKTDAIDTKKAEKAKKAAAAEKAKKAAEKAKELSKKKAAIKSPGIADLTKKPPKKTLAEMPVEMKQMVAVVLKNLGVDETGTVSGEPTPDAIAAATNLASVLEQQGYEDAAKQLREYAKAAGKKVTVPDKIVSMPGLPPEIQDQVNRAIKMERDPKKLRALAAAIRLLPNANDPQIKNTADMLDALAAQVEAGQEQAKVLSEIDNTIKDKKPGTSMPTDFDLEDTDAMKAKEAADAAASQAAAQAAAAAAAAKKAAEMAAQHAAEQAAQSAVIYVVKQGDTPYKLAQKYAPGGGGSYMQLLKANPEYPKDGKGTNFKQFYAGMRLHWPPTWANPDTMATPVVAPPVAPAVPVVTPSAPQPKTPVEQAAEAMVSQLNAVLRNAGGDVKAAKGKEDTGLVANFQRLAGVTADGKPGPGTMALAAEHGQCDLPLVFRWPVSATSKNVINYRTSLLAIADRRQAAGQTACANSLRMAAARERGQGGIVGAMPA